MSKLRNFIVAAHSTPEEAERALALLEQLMRENVVSVDDAAIVAQNTKGEVELHQRRSLSVGGGVVGGGTAGVLAGLLIGFPIAGALIGMAAGGRVGTLDTGIDDDRMTRLGRELSPGQAALCVLVSAADWPQLRARMAPFAGELLVVELTPEAEAALAQAADRHEVEE